MRKYSQITRNDQTVGHKTIRGLKLAVQNGKEKIGIYKCQCPNGNVHLWEIELTGTHVCAGTTKKKIKVGEGLNKSNYSAKFIATTMKTPVLI